MNKSELKELFKKYENKNPTLDKYIYPPYDNLIDKIIMLHELQIGELEAKVYTYEKIISNSNFKSVLSKDKQKLEKRIKELESQLIEKEKNNEKN